MRINRKFAASMYTGIFGLVILWSALSSTFTAAAGSPWDSPRITNVHVAEQAAGTWSVTGFSSPAEVR